MGAVDHTDAPGASSQLVRGSLVTFASVAIPVAVYFVLPLDRETWWIGALLGGAAVLAVLPLTVRRLIWIDQSDRPVVDALRALALLLGLAVAGFATTNYAIAANTEQIPGVSTKIDGLYFTVVTMTSVGYGDIAPQGQAARAIVTLEIMLTLTLIGGAIRMISNLAGRKRAER